MLQLQLETTAVCNARCHFCVYPTPLNSREKGKMGSGLFRKIIDEAATIEPLTEVCLTGLGETLLDPDLVERVRYIRDKIPKVLIQVYTNGTYLTEEKFVALQDAGLDMVVVSLNAADAETRKRVMGLDDFDKVVMNIIKAIGAERTCKVNIRAVTNLDSFTYPDAEPLFRLWGERMVAVREGNWAGEMETKRDFTPNECCWRALHMIYVTFDGKVTPCCFDPFGKSQFGDLNKQSLREIYNSEKYTGFREDHAADQADKHAICAGCSRI